MRIILTALLGIVAGSSAYAAPADPYPWCAEYSFRSGASNCYFMTLQQCQATVSGNGGFCRENLFYNPGPKKTGSSRPPRQPKQ